MSDTKPLTRKEQILVVSLTLFNNVGVANLAVIDIANEMDISPGNLYYHYKGKSEILSALLDCYEETLNGAFRKSTEKGVEGKDSWLPLYALLELMFRYRFLFRNILDIKSNYPDAEGTINRILLTKYSIVVDILTAITAPYSNEPGSEVPADIVMVMILNWFDFRALAAPGEKMRTLVHSGMIRIERLLAPYCSVEMCAFMRLSNENYVDVV